jgi:hypothetical protein
MISLSDNDEAEEIGGITATPDVGEPEVNADEDVDDEANGEEDEVCEDDVAVAVEIDEEGVYPVVPLELMEELPTFSTVTALADDVTRWGAEDEDNEERGADAVEEMDSDENDEEEDDGENEGDSAIVDVDEERVGPVPLVLMVEPPSVPTVNALVDEDKRWADDRDDELMADESGAVDDAVETA